MKISQPNPLGKSNVCLQSRNVLEQLKQIDTHARRNILKKRQDILEGGPRRLFARRNSDVPCQVSMDTTASTPLAGTSTHTKKEKILSANSGTLGSAFKPLTKCECLMAQQKHMVAITRILEGSSEARGNLLVARHRIGHAKATSVEISNIKQAMEMRVLSIEEGKKKVAKLLDVK